MAEIQYNHDFLEDKPLSFVLDLKGVENPEGWEGWLTYEIKLTNGEDIVAGRSNLTIIDDDIEALCRLLRDAKPERFEPMEPDFQLQVLPLEGQDRARFGKDFAELFVFLDEGVRRSTGYAGAGLGFRMLVGRKELSKFAEDLKSQLMSLTQGLHKV